MRNQMKMNEKNAAIDRHRAMKEQTRENIIRQKKMYDDKIKGETDWAKEEKRQNKEQFYLQKQQEQIKATQIKQMIKTQQHEQKTKIQKLQQDRQVAAQRQMQEKLQREEQERLEHERMIQ